MTKNILLIFLVIILLVIKKSMLRGVKKVSVLTFMMTLEYKFNIHNMKGIISEFTQKYSFLRAMTLKGQSYNPGEKS